MKQKKIIVLAIFIIISISSFFVYQNKKPKNINKILETKAYSYLPKKAQTLIKEIYEETGEIVLTEKNKKVNEPYLNPLYVEYISLSDAEKENIDDIPMLYTVDSAVLPVDGADPPKSFDLRKINNDSTKKYITEIKNQSTLDLCWAFTSVEQVESYNLLKNNTPYSSNSLVLSPRQMDYATSTDGIRDYENTEAGTRLLTKGGNFLAAANIMANGLSLVKDSVLPFTESTDPEELEKILNYDNSEFELTSSEVYLQNSYAKGTNAYNTFMAKIKNKIMTYGGAYVSTQAPGYSCASNNTDNNQIIRVDSACTQNGGHAMQIIGWDDDYSYSYCHSTCNWTDPDTNVTSQIACHAPASSCSSSERITGTGAWILRNSWGDIYPYVYLAYDSPTAAIYFTTGIQSMKNKTWDNNYSIAVDFERPGAGTTIGQTFTKKVDTVEKVEKVKFHTFGQNGTYKISITSDSKNYLNITSVTVPEVGYTTVDLSSYNIYITDPSFSVYIEETNKTVKALNETISVFTSNVDSIPVLDTTHYYSDVSDGGYEIDVYSVTKNIPSNTAITFQLQDDKGNDLSSHIEYQYNHIATNNMNAKVLIDNTLPAGIYTLKALYDGYEYLSKVIIGVEYRLSGDGTADSPFLIYTEEDLRKMSIYMDGHYRLENDIVMQDKWIPIGTNTAPFVGSLDGNGHTIENLVVEGNVKNGGLFGYVKAAEDNSTTIKNLTIKNANIEGQQDTAILIGTVIGPEGYDWDKPTSTMNLEGIYFINGKAYSNYGSAGSLIGSIAGTNSLYHGKHTYNINKIFTSAQVGGATSSGLIGSITGGTESAYSSNIYMNNIENLGIINLIPLTEKGILTAMDTHASIVGTFNNYVIYQLKYYISSPLLRGFEYTGKGLLGNKSSNTSTSTTYGYNTLNGTTSILSLKNASNYNNWTNFYNNWKIETIDSISRIPILKDVDMEYTTISNIEVEPNTTVSMKDYLSSDNLARMVASDVSDNTVVSINNKTDDKTGQNYDVEISTLKTGETTIHFVSNYDGYENTIALTSGVPITDFSVTKDSIGIDIGEEYNIVYSIAPTNNTDNTVINWQSANNSIATVSQEGIITGIAYGTTTITGTLSNNMSVSISVEVRQAVPITSFIVSNEYIPLNSSSSRTITTMITPSNTTENKYITWTSSNESIAIVSDGTITGVGVGEATITGTLENGMTVTVQVNVKNEPVIYQKGDLNYDDTVDISDVIVALRKVFKYQATDNKDLEVGDLDNNESLDINDVIKMLRYVFRYISSLE